MFRRVLLENWHDYVPYLGFALIGGAFIVIVIRALRMKPSEVEKLSAMPLRDADQEEDEDDTKERPDTSSSDTDQK